MLCTAVDRRLRSKVFNDFVDSLQATRDIISQAAIGAYALSRNNRTKFRWSQSMLIFFPVLFRCRMQNSFICRQIFFVERHNGTENLFCKTKKKNKKINSKPRCQHKNNLHALLVQTKTNPFFRCWRYNVPWNVLPTTPHHTAQTYVLDRVYNKIPLGILFSLRLLLSHQHLLKAKTIGPNAEYARDFIILLFCVSSMAV